MRSAVIAALSIAPALTLAGPATAQTMVSSPAELKHYSVTVRRFDPAQGIASGVDFILPVDSPDEEHAAASTLSNAISFSRKTQGMQTLPVAFMVTKVAMRR